MGPGQLHPQKTLKKSGWQSGWQSTLGSPAAGQVGALNATRRLPGLWAQQGRRAEDQPCCPVSCRQGWRQAPLPAGWGPDGSFVQQQLTEGPGGVLTSRPARPMPMSIC